MEERKKVREANATSFTKGYAKIGGRKPDSGNTMPKQLKECILLAAELEGSDGKGKDGAVGFLRCLANRDISAFGILLSRVLPLQVEAKSDPRFVVRYETAAEVRREMKAKGFTSELLRMLADELEVEDDSRSITIRSSDALARR